MLFTCGLAGSKAQAASPVTFANAGEGAGQVNNPAAVAVDQATGNVYVADEGNFRIDKFSSTGEFLLAWGYGVGDGRTDALQTCGPQATPPTAECFALPGGGSREAPAALAPVHLAVDPVSGDVYVTSSLRYAVQKFSPGGQFLSIFGDEVDKTTGADVCTAADLAAGDECGSGVRGSEPGQLEGFFPPVAVDESGDVWVGDTGRLEEFSSAGDFLLEVSLAGAEFFYERGDLAVAAGGDFYVIDSATEGVQKLSPSGAVIETLDPTGGEYRTLSLDGAGNLYVADRQAFESPAVFREFAPDGEQISQFGNGEIFGTQGPFGIAFGDAAKALYSLSGGESTEAAAQRFALPQPGPEISNGGVREVLPTSATLLATLDPEGHATTYHFEYGTDQSYGHSTPAGTLAAGFYDEPVEASIGGLTPATTYDFRLVADDDEGRTAEGLNQTFTTPPAVQIENPSTTEVAATAATFEADLNPFGEPAEWWLEYGSGGSYEFATAKQALAGSEGPVSVSFRLDGLTAGTTYRYRFVAADELDGARYIVVSEDKALKTEGSSSAALLDGRAWELVTPPVKSGLVLNIGEFGDLQAAAGGDGIAYLTAPVTEDSAGSRGSDSVLAQRDPTGGWKSTDLALPEGEVVGVNGPRQYPYLLFNPELSQAVVERSINGNQPEGDNTPLSPEASEQTPYLRRLPCDGRYAECFAPMVTGKEGFANVPSGTSFGGKLDVVAASPDTEHVIIGSQVALTPETAPEGGLYEWSAESRQLQLVSVLPDGTPAVQAQIGWDDFQSRQAISADGSRVIFSSQGHLYLRDTAVQKTVQIDLPQGGPGVGPVGANFQTASSDGSRVFFTSEQKLTPDSNAKESKADLYVCEVQTGGILGNLNCVLRDLTPGSPSEAAAVRYMIPGASEDGSTVYFFANGDLAEGAVEGNCHEEGPDVPSPAELCNLYVVRFAEGHWGSPRHVATLSREDGTDWDTSSSAGPGAPQPDRLTARVSTDGRWLAFMSSRALTGYDSRDAETGKPDEEVYLYDNAGEGHLLCVSCNPSGARPRGEEIPFTSEAADGQKNWRFRWLAANVPGWLQSAAGRDFHQPRYLSDSGRVFFNSLDALVPGDANHQWDVYEFEPAGVGDCTSGTPGFSPGNGGCVGLISSGASGSQSAFVDASESGDDVFFWTHAKLASDDVDTAADIYDAHVCRTSSPCLQSTPTPPPCAEPASCRGPLAEAPEMTTPGSASPLIPGNPKSGAKKKHHKKKYHKKKHRKKRHSRVRSRRAKLRHGGPEKGAGK